MKISKFAASVVIASMVVSSGPILSADNGINQPVPVEVMPEAIKVEIPADKLKVPAKTVTPRHWVYDELAAFKQLMLPVVQSSTVAEENKNILLHHIFNAAKLDQPIQADHWVFLLGTVLELPAEKSEQLLDMYAYGLSTGNEIKREDAAGGLVKLLTLRYLSGQTSAADLEPAKVLKDLDIISDRQSVLVQKAYCEGILDSTVKDMFRPADRLTNAEAVSVLYRVMQKYHIDLNDTGSNGYSSTQQHWADRELEAAAAKAKKKAERINGVERIIQAKGADESVKSLDSPITIDKWNELLFYTLNLEEATYEKSFLESYTYGLTNDKYVTRASAVAGMVKLLHASEKVGWRDATEDQKAAAAAYFTDYSKFRDQSKLSIAFAEGLITGFKDCSFKPEKKLTNGEALVLMLRIIHKYD